MNKKQCSALAAILASVLCARPAAAGTLDDLKVRIGDYAGCPSPAIAAPPAAPAAVPPAVVRVAVVPAVVIPNEIAEAMRMDPELAAKLNQYYAYEAFTSGDPRRCEPVSDGNQGPCFKILTKLNFVRASVGPREDFVKACRQATETVRDPERLAAYCELVAEHGSDVAGLCAKAVPAYLGDAEVCRHYFSSLYGDASSCKHWVKRAGAPVKEIDPECESNAAFAQAFKAKNVSLCAGSRRCRVLMGEGEKVSAELAAGLTGTTAQWFLLKGWTMTENDRKAHGFPLAGPLKSTSPPFRLPLPAPSAPPAPPAPPAGFKGFICKVLKRA